MLHTLTKHAEAYGVGDSVRAVAISADGRHAVSGRAELPEVQVWDLDSGATLHTLTCDPNYGGGWLR
jgi:hypothetical protein